jgi:hypothetical protein
MKLLFLHILFFALSLIAIYSGFTKTIKYVKKLQKYKDEKTKAAICIGMIVLAIFIFSCGIFLLYTEIESFIKVNS